MRALRRSCLLVLLAAAGARAADSPVFADPTSPPYPIWPIPQEAAYENDRLLLGDATIVVPPGDERAQLPGRMLAEIVADHFGAVIPVVEGAAPQGRTPIVVGELSHAVVAGALSSVSPGLTVPEEAEAYALRVGDTGAVVAGCDYRGALYGDHFVDWHNRFGRKWSEGGPVRYEKPDTTTARDRLAAAGARLHVFNWSREEGDATFRKLGWPFLIGNFAGSREKDWPGRVDRHGTLGGEVSSWGALEELLLGKLQVPEAAFSINLLWSRHYPAREAALEQVGLLMPEVRRLVSASPPPSLTARPMRFEVLDVRSAFNHEAKGEGWDLTGLEPGRGYRHGVPYAIGDPGRGPSTVVVARRPGDEPTRAVLPVSGRWASLLFVTLVGSPGPPTRGPSSSG